MHIDALDSFAPGEELPLQQESGQPAQPTAPVHSVHTFTSSRIVPNLTSRRGKLLWRCRCCRSNAWGSSKINAGCCNSGEGRPSSTGGLLAQDALLGRTSKIKRSAIDPRAVDSRGREMAAMAGCGVGCR